MKIKWGEGAAHSSRGTALVPVRLNYEVPATEQQPKHLITREVLVPCHVIDMTEASNINTVIISRDYVTAGVGSPLDGNPFQALLKLKLSGITPVFSTSSKAKDVVTFNTPAPDSEPHLAVNNVTLTATMEAKKATLWGTGDTHNKAIRSSVSQ